MSNWIDSGGLAPRLDSTDVQSEDLERRTLADALEDAAAHQASRSCCWRSVPDLGHARDPRPLCQKPPELKAWFDGLKSGKGPCCSDADGTAVSDVDWEIRQRALSRAARWRMGRRA